jgi:hypothetical protein
MSLFQDMRDRWSALERQRQPWMGYWQELADILLPNRADFTRARGQAESRETGIYDGTPRLALRDLASTLDGLMKPKTSTWFDGQIDDDLADDDSVKAWYEQVRDRMWRAIYRTDARFIQRSGEIDLNLAAFGWGVLWIQQNRLRNGLLFRAFHNAQAAIGENEDGIIDTIGVQETFNARQADAIYKRAGKDLPRLVSDALKNIGKTGQERFPFVQIVLPRDDRDAGKIGTKNMPFASAVIDIKSEIVVAETGFEEFPAAVPRWDTAPGEIYARCPGMMALPDSKTLQAMGKTLLVGGQRAVDPPIWVSNDAVMSPLRTFPGGITTLDLTDAPSGQAIGVFPVSTNIPLGREMQNDYRRNVEAAFFKNVFNLPIEGRQMTATEILERKEEFIRTIGPVFGRLESDYIGHTVERVFGIMERAGAFPPRPDALQDRKVMFRFQSPLQQARKAIEIAGLARTVEVLAPFAARTPEIMDNFDEDQIARDVPEAVGVPTKWLRPVDQVAERRRQRAEAEAEARTAEQAKPLSEALKNVATTEATLPG